MTRHVNSSWSSSEISFVLTPAHAIANQPRSQPQTDGVDSPVRRFANLLRGQQHACVFCRDRMGRPRCRHVRVWQLKELASDVDGYLKTPSTWPVDQK